MSQDTNGYSILFFESIRHIWNKKASSLNISIDVWAIELVTDYSAQRNPQLLPAANILLTSKTVQVSLNYLKSGKSVTSEQVTQYYPDMEVLGFFSHVPMQTQHTSEVRYM